MGDINRVYFGGSSAAGNAPTSVATDWVSYTFPRPAARLAPNGQRLMIVKKLRFQVGGKGAKRKVYGRVSYADGDPNANSSSITVAAQTSAKTNIDCKLSFPMTDSLGGPNMRVWIVTGSTFYFDRNKGASGHLVGSGKKTFSGAPVGYMEYAEVPSAPSNVTAVRDTDDPTRVTFAWSKEADLGGGSLMGYTIQVADDTTFSVNVQSFQVNGLALTRSGFAIDQVYYVRVAADNEVSNQFQTTGLWSPYGTLGIYTPATVPLDDAGADIPEITYMGNDPAPGDPTPLEFKQLNTMQDAVRLEATGQWYGIQNDASSKGINDVTITRFTTGGFYLDSMKLTDGGHGTSMQLENTSSGVYVWTTFEGAGKTGRPNDIVRFRYTPGTFTRDKLPSVSVQPKFGDGYLNIMFDWLNNWCAIRRVPSTGTIETYELRRITEYRQGVDKTYGKITLPIRPPSVQGFATYQGSLFRWTGTADSTTDLSILREYSWATGDEVAEFDGTDLGRNGDGTYTDGYNEPEGLALYNVDNTTPTLYVGVVTGIKATRKWQVWPISLLTQAAALQQIPTSSDPGGTDGSDDGSAGGSSNNGGSGSTTGGTPSDGSDPTTGTTVPVVYTPIPDTTSTRTVMGGLLISRTGRKAPGHSVFLMERGGKRRLGQFVGLTSVTYNRIRDDQSQATIVLSGDSIAANQEVIDRMAPGRHELCIYRGDERVWEGPITLPQWRKQSVEITATDITQYLNRTTMHAAYSNASPATDFAVARIAGIIQNELARKESLSPPVNVLPYLRTYVEAGDARTARVTDAFTQSVWQHLDDMAAKSGIDYTVVGRALHIWDTSRAALGRTQKVTENDFLGDTYISAYVVELATSVAVSDGQGGYGIAGANDPFYGEIELVTTAYDESADPDPDTITVTQAELNSQAKRNLSGRNPVPLGLHVPDGSAFSLERLGLDVLIPGVFVPVVATLAGKQVSQMLKLREVTVTEDSSGERATISLSPIAGVIDGDTPDEQTTEDVSS
jgi:hypothetical protein